MSQRPVSTPNLLFIGRSAWSEHGGIQRFNQRVASAMLGIDGQMKVLMILDRQETMPESAGGKIFYGFSGSITKFLLTFVRCIFVSDILFVGHVNLVPFAFLFKLLRPYKKVILFSHGIEVWNDARYRQVRFYEPCLIRWTVNRVAIVSAYSQRLMAHGFNLPMSRFILFPNAINVPDYPKRNDRRGSNVLVVSRLAPTELEKHVDKIIQALPIVRNVIGDASLTIVGDGALRSSLESLAKKIGVKDHVQFSGFVTEDELNNAYEKASVFALASSKEGFGIVYLEAWSRGLPVIASKYGAAPEVVADGIDGFTVDPSNYHEIAEKLILLLSSPELSEKFAAAGWEKLNKQYSDEAFKERLSKICLMAMSKEITLGT